MLMILMKLMIMNIMKIFMINNKINIKELIK